MTVFRFHEFIADIFERDTLFKLSHQTIEIFYLLHATSIKNNELLFLQ